MASPFLRPLGRSFGIAAIIAILSALVPATTALGTGPQTFTVDSTADTAGDCALPTQCTLRQAINDANATVDADTILFAIGSGIQTITLTTELPPIEQPVLIDGTSQPGYLPLSPSPMIELNGESLDYSRGLMLYSGSNTVRGLIFNRFGAEAIRVSSDGNNIEGNYIGLDKTGTAIFPGHRSWPAGILVMASNNTIGGAALSKRNVISGNTHGISFDYQGSGNVVLGNYIGTDSTGSVALGNLNSGIDINIGSDQVIGGTGPGEGNVVAGAADSSAGIYAGTTGNTILGNLIGVTATGAPFPDKNYGNGVILSGSGNKLGGTAPGAGNVISGWSERGVGTSGTGHEIVGNLIGTDATGMVADGNGYAGIIVQSSNTLIESNVISANGGQPGWGYGVFISDPDNSGNVIRANMIGTASDGVSPLGNDNQGVLFNNQTNGNVLGGTNPGDGNVIANNAREGVFVSPYGGPCCAYANRILGNSIYSNGTEAEPALGIALGYGGANDAYDLDTGANGLQNYPDLGAVTTNGVSNTTITGTLSSTPSRSFRIELFRTDSCDPSGYGEGQVYLGSVDVATDSNGNATFSKNVAQVIDSSVGFVTATATNQTANETSAFSHCNVWPRTTSEADVAPGGIVTSSPTTSTTEPVATSVQLSAIAGGNVTIVDGPTTMSPPSASYSFLGVQVAIDAPAGDALNPLTLTFRLDPSITSGLGPADLHVFRTGDGSTTPIEVMNCTATGPIDPDPCVAERGYTETYGIRITVLTSHASTWNFGIVVPSLLVLKQVAMGPQAMEGDLKVAMGSTLKVGYDFTIPSKHVAQNVSFVGAHVDFAYTCVAGPSTPKGAKPAGSGNLSVPIPDAAYLDPANSTAWYPSAKQSDASVYQGSLVLATDLCSANGLVRLQKGGTFSFGIASDGNHEKINVRWHYSANGGAGGWSGTKSVTPN